VTATDNNARTSPDFVIARAFDAPRGLARPVAIA